MFFSEIYDGWEEIQKEKYRMIFDVIGGEFLSMMLKKRTLDIGCGRGFLQKFIEERGIKSSIYGVDIEVPAKKSMQFVVADGDWLPFRNESFDFIISIDTMHLLGGDDFRRVLKKRGFVLLATFFNNDNFHQRRNILYGKLRGFEVLAEFETQGREKEYIILARKRYA